MNIRSISVYSQNTSWRNGKSLPDFVPSGETRETFACHSELRLYSRDGFMRTTDVVREEYFPNLEPKGAGGTSLPVISEVDHV